MSQNKKLSEERKGQIALLMLKKDIATKQLVLNRADYQRKIGNAANELKEYGVTKDELTSMYEELVRENVDKMFGRTEKKSTFLKI